MDKMMENEDLGIMSGDEDDLGGHENLREQIGKAHLLVVIFRLQSLALITSFSMDCIL